MRKIDTIVIHCTATPEGRPTSVATVAGWHKARGFKDIGYHYLVQPNGSIDPGRALWEVGAHVAGHNSTSIGIAYVGGLDAETWAPKDTRTEAQKSALRAIIGQLKDRFPEIDKVVGHRDLDPKKACPCFDVATAL